MSDIVERLREGICDDKCKIHNIASGCECAEAADEIERLQTALGIYKYEAEAQIEWQKTEIERLRRIILKDGREFERLRAALHALDAGANPSS